MRWVALVVLLGLVLAQAVPKLPFSDNPDPSLCGIPIPWGRPDTAWLDGHYQGKLVEPVVYLYDSHTRNRIIGQAPSGTPVRIKLFQANPKLDYYFVQTLVQPRQEGWVPAPFLRHQP
ncbi:MAG: hypothetical protein IVW51_13660 [Thermaceae bacterium]|nr:hypothetical protein [Thermaceae bacterium]